MKSNEARNAMVARVQAVYAEYPTYESLPVIGDSALAGATLKEHKCAVPSNGEEYVKALYQASVHGKVKARGVDGDLYWGED